MLNFYTEFSNAPALTNKPCVPLIPKRLYTSSEIESEDIPWRSLYNHYWKSTSKSTVQLVELADAEVLVLPYDWFWYRGPRWLRQVSKSVAKAVEETNTAVYQKALAVGKPALLFFSGDCSHEPTPFPEAITFREGLYASRKGPRDHCMPAFSEDIAHQIPTDIQGKRRGAIVLREKPPKPTVGFCGLAPQPKSTDHATDLAYYLHTFLRHRHFEASPKYGERLRHQAITALNNSDKIHTNFIIRDTSVFLGNLDFSQRKKFREEFVNNMVNSDYVLCCRGSGNYSYRVYETLCMGRIPVVVAPDSELPYEFHMDWRDYCLFVPDTNLKRISDRIYEHYNALSPDAYHEQQLACRRVWEDYLSPEGFFKHLSLHWDKVKSV